MRIYGAVAAGLSAVCLLGACSDRGASASGDKTSVAVGRVEAGTINYRIETVADGLDHPWSLAFLPGGDMLVTERTGKLKRIKADGGTDLVYDFNALKEAPVHYGDGLQAGLFDVVLDPEFETNQHIYISYAAKQSGGKNTLRLMRYRYVDGERGQLSEGTELFLAQPARKQGIHYGARIAFLPDGTLMMTTGEAFHYREKAQDLSTHFGKIIRLHTDGRVPKDNPFLGREDALPEIYSYGHRNPQGLLLATDGRLLEHEHGPAGGDEINEILPGINYGWPTVSYGIDYSGSRISPFEARDGTAQSLVHFTPSIAPSGFAQYQGDVFPDWQGDLFLSALVLEHVRHINVNADGSLGAQAELFGELKTRFRDVRSGPDGHLYLLTENKDGGSQVLRVTPK